MTEFSLRVRRRAADGRRTPGSATSAEGERRKESSHSQSTPASRLRAEADGECLPRRRRRMISSRRVLASGCRNAPEWLSWDNAGAPRSEQLWHRNTRRRGKREDVGRERPTLTALPGTYGQCKAVSGGRCGPEGSPPLSSRSKRRAQLPVRGFGRFLKCLAFRAPGRRDAFLTPVYN